MDRLLLVCWQGACEQVVARLMREKVLPEMAEIFRSGMTGNIQCGASADRAMHLATVATGLAPDHHGTANTGVWDLLAAQGLCCGTVDWPLWQGKILNQLLPSDPDSSWEKWKVFKADLDPGLVKLLIPRLDQAPPDDLRLDRLRTHLAGLYSTHGKAIDLLARGQLHFLAVNYRFLADVTRDFGVYASTREGILPEDREIFGGVLANAHSLQDLLLADLRRQQMADLVFLALPEGSSSGQFAAVGSSFTAGLVRPARLWDIAPTILRRFGMKPPSGVEGRAFVPLPPGTNSVEAAEPSLTALHSSPYPDEQTGIALLDLFLPIRALPFLEQAYFSVPENALLADALARCYTQLGLLEEAETVLTAMPGAAGRTGRLALLRAQVELGNGRFRAALELAETARHNTDAPVEMCDRITAAALLSLNRAAEALPLIDDAIERDPCDARAFYGRALAHLSLCKLTGARISIEEALRLVPSWPPAMELRDRLAELPSLPPPDARPLWQMLALRANRRDVLRQESQARRQAFLLTRQPANLPSSYSWCVRPARPTEQDRIRRYFQLPPVPPWRQWIISVGDLQQITGVMQFSEFKGHFAFALEKAWVSTPAAAELLRTTQVEASIHGFPFLSCSADPAGEFADVLRLHGFEEEKREEVWSVPFAVALEKNHDFLARLLRPRPLSVSALTAETAPIAARLAAEHGLLPPSLESNPQELSQRFDSQLSFLAGDPHCPSGILLARSLSGVLYIEVMAENPAMRHRATVPALLRATFTAAAARGARTAICTFSPSRTPSLPALLRRGQGKLERTTSLFRKPLI